MGGPGVYNRVITAKEENQVDRQTRAGVEKMQALADIILDKIRICVEQTKPENVSPQSFKHITGIMKDLKDILRTQADIDEQAAKLKNLRRQLEQEGAMSVTVTLAPELEDYVD